MQSRWCHLSLEEEVVVVAEGEEEHQRLRLV